jgi:hypothetical protein
MLIRVLLIGEWNELLSIYRLVLCLDIVLKVLRRSLMVQLWNILTGYRLY